MSTDFGRNNPDRSQLNEDLFLSLWINQQTLSQITLFVVKEPQVRLIN